MRLGTTIIVLSGLLPSSCSFSLGSNYWGSNTRRGSGNGVEERRDLPAFTAVRVSGSFDVNVRAGESQEVRVYADDNLLPSMRTEVRDGELFVDMEGSYRSRLDFRVDIRTPELREVDLRGSGDIRIRDFEGEDLRVQLHGSGDVWADGRVVQLDLDLRGSGDIQMEEMVADRVSVQVRGSGDVSVHAREQLDVRIYGSGDVAYRGNPAPNVSIRGSGNVKRMR